MRSSARSIARTAACSALCCDLSTKLVISTRVASTAAEICFPRASCCAFVSILARSSASLRYMTSVVVGSCWLLLPPSSDEGCCCCATWVALDSALLAEAGRVWLTSLATGLEKPGKACRASPKKAISETSPSSRVPEIFRQLRLSHPCLEVLHAVAAGIPDVAQIFQAAAQDRHTHDTFQMLGGFL